MVAITERFKGLLRRIERIGLSKFEQNPDQDIEPRTIVLTNSIAGLSASVSLLNSAVEFAQRTYFYATSDLIAGLLVLATLAINALGAFKFARIYLLLLLNLDIYYFNIISRFSTGLELLHLMFVLFSFFLFSTRERWSLVITTLIPFALFCLSRFYPELSVVPAQYTEAAPSWYGIAVPVVTFGSTFYVIHRFLRIVDRKNREISLLGAIASASNESASGDDAIAKCLALVCDYTGWNIGHAWQLKDDVMVSRKVWHTSDSQRFARFVKQTETLSFASGIDLPGRAFETKHSVWMDSLTDDQGFARADLAQEVALKSGLGMPIFVGADVVSVIEFFTTQGKRPDDEKLKLLEGVGVQIGRVLERENHAEQVRALSLTDELTGLSNRRGFMALAAQQLRVAARSPMYNAVLFADMDGLKRINDVLGHEAGDAAISAFAAVLKKTFRDSDAVARLGGDEFAVFMTCSVDNTSDIMLARLQRNLDEHNRAHPQNEPLAASLGIVVVKPEMNDSLDALLARADARMYENKRARRAARA